MGIAAFIEVITKNKHKMDLVEEPMSQTEDELPLATDVETTDVEATDVEATDVEEFTDVETTDVETTDAETPVVPFMSAGTPEVPDVSAGKKAPKRRRKVVKRKKAKKAKKSRKGKKKGSKKRRSGKGKKLKLREMIMLILKSSGKKGVSFANIMSALQSRFKSKSPAFFVKQTLKWLRKKRVIRRNNKGKYVSTGRKLVLLPAFGCKPNRSGRPKGAKGKKKQEGSQTKTQEGFKEVQKAISQGFKKESQDSPP